MKKRLLSVFLICTASVCLFAGCSKSENSENAKENVTLILDWTPNTNHTGFYVAKEKGYYDDLGINLQIIQPEEGSALNLLAASKGDFAVSFQDDLTYAKTSDNPLPVKAIGAIIAHNTSGFLSPKDKNIESVKDFEGKVYGGYGGPSEKAVLKAVMEKQGADYNKLTAVDVPNDDFFMATKDRIDFMWTYEGWTNIQAKLKNIDVNYIPIAQIDERLDYYTPIIATSESVIKNKKDMVKKFMEATSKGYEYAIENPEESADILVSYAPEIDKDLALSSQIYLKDKYKDSNLRWGEMQDIVWDRYTEFLLQNGLIDKKLDASEAYTNEFLPE